MAEYANGVDKRQTSDATTEHFNLGCNRQEKKTHIIKIIVKLFIHSFIEQSKAG